MIIEKNKFDVCATTANLPNSLCCFKGEKNIYILCSSIRSEFKFGVNEVHLLLQI